MAKKEITNYRKRLMEYADVIEGEIYVDIDYVEQVLDEIESVISDILAMSLIAKAYEDDSTEEIEEVYDALDELSDNLY